MLLQIHSPVKNKTTENKENSIYLCITFEKSFAFVSGISNCLGKFDEPINCEEVNVCRFLTRKIENDFGDSSTYVQREKESGSLN